jgi:RHS repeat-associated protein
MKSRKRGSWHPGLLAAAILTGSSVLAAGLTIVTATVASAAVSVRCLGSPPALPIAASDVDTYSLDSSGSLWGWGSNYFGELGNGSTTDVAVPLNASGFNSIQAISTGLAHVLALRQDGTVWAWGDDEYGQLGDGQTGFGHSQTTPIQVQGLPPNVVAIDAHGAQTSFAITSDGRVFAWGRNDWGQVGDGTTTTRAVPAQILTGFKAIAPSLTFTLGLKSDGTVWGWGHNSYYVLGRSVPLYADPLSPVQLPPADISAVTAISAGENHSVALKSDGTVWSWGQGAFGQPGNGTFDDHDIPVFSGVSGVSQIAAGGRFTLALNSGGTAYGWGQNMYGELGNPAAATYQATPMQVSTITGVSALAAGMGNAVAVTSDGGVWDWGLNTYGQIGDGTTNGPQTTPYRTSVGQSTPSMPTNLEAAAGNGLAYLTWKAPTSAITQFVVTPILNGQPQADVAVPVSAPPQGAPPGTTSSYTVSGLTQGGNYTFKVAAQNCLGTGTQTSESNRVIPTGVQLGQDSFKVESSRVTDRMTLHVNTFNGNLSVAEHDVGIKGTGLDLTVDRAYNNKAATTSTFGYNWTASTNVSLTVLGDGSVYFNGPGGSQVGFAKITATTFAAPSGIDAKLIKNGDGTYTLSFNASEDVWRFTSAGAATSHADRNGNTISFAYGGPGGRLSQITDTQARVTTFAYNASNLVASVTDPGGRLYQYGYDASQNLTTYTDPANAITRFAYDANHNLTQITTPAGRVVTIGYDGASRATSIGHPNQAGNPTTTFAYDATDTRVIDADSHTTTYTFDPVGRTTKITDGAGNQVASSYTSNSNIATYSTGNGAAGGNYSYDSNNNLNSATVNPGAHSTLGYTDPNHPFSPTTVTDPQNNTTTVAYDAKGNPITETDPLPSQNQVQITRTGNNPNLLSADDSGLEAGMGGWGCTLNCSAARTSAAAQDGAWSVAMTASAAARMDVATATGAGGVPVVAGATYSAMASMRAATTARSVTAYIYWFNSSGANVSNNTLSSATDSTSGWTRVSGTVVAPAGAAFAQVVPSVPAPASGEVHYVDDIGLFAGRLPSAWSVGGRGFPLGTMSASADPDGHQTTYGYDSRANLTSVTPPAPLGTESMINDSLSRPTTVTDGKAQRTQYAYDPMDRVTLITYNDSTTVRYVYDADGNPTSMTDATGTTSMAYDAMGRLTSRTTPDNKTVSYTYDGAGNLLTLADSGGTTTYTYNAVNLPTQVRDPSNNVINLGYDANNNRNSVGYPNGVTVYTMYDSANRLVNTHTTNQSMLNDTYSYTPSGPAHASAKAITMRGSPSTYATNGTTASAITLATPTGLAAGDVEIAQISVAASATVASVPTGWTQVRQDTTGSTVNDLRQTIYSHVAGASEPLRYSWGLSQATYANGALTVWTGVDTTSPVETSAGQVNSAGSTSWTAPSVSYQNGELDLVLYGGRLLGGTSALGAPANYTEAYDTQTTGVTVGLDTRTMGATASSTGAQTVTGPTARWVGQQVLLRPVYDTSLVQSTPAGFQTYDALNRLTQSSGYNYTYDGASNRLAQDRFGEQAVTYAYNNANQLTSATKVISLVGTGTGAGIATPTSPTFGVTLPAGTQAGDQILLSVTETAADTVSVPGYQTVGNAASGLTPADARTVVFRRTATGSAADTPSVTPSVGASAVAVLAVYRGVDPSSPFDNPMIGATVAGTRLTIPGVTTSMQGEQLVVFQGAVSNSAPGTWTPSNGLSEQAQNTSQTARSAGLADKRLGTLTGYAGEVTSTLATTSSPNLAGVAVPLRPAAPTNTYDADGNLTGSSDGASLSYDAANRTTNIRPAGGTNTTFTYRGAGQSERASMSPASRIGAACTVISGCPPSTVSVGSTATFQHSQLGVTAETDGGATTYYVRDPRGGLLAERTPSGGTYYYLFDGHGSVVGLTDPSGAVAAEYGYDPYGRLTWLADPSGVGVYNPWRYVGAYQDGTGLYKMGARYYDPTTGRWTQQDPIANPLDPGQWNRYTYVGGDPINFVDPMGTRACPPPEAPYAVSGAIGVTDSMIVGGEIILALEDGEVIVGAIASVLTGGAFAVMTVVTAVGIIVVSLATGTCSREMAPGAFGGSPSGTLA